MYFIQARLLTVGKYLQSFFKWSLIAVFIGIFGGTVGSLFHICIEYVTGLRVGSSWLIYLLPVGGVGIVFLYHHAHGNEERGTNLVISSVRANGEHPSPFLAPLIFISTVITHLFGGSAGREGAALQIGGGIGTQVGRLLHLDEKDMSIITMCGMTAVFAALFGTPLTAVMFALEVISVGVIYYIGLVPCCVSAIVAVEIAKQFGLQPVKYTLPVVPDVSIKAIVQVGIISIMCAIMCIIFCKLLKLSCQFFVKTFRNDYIAIAVGAIVVVLLTLVCNSHDYNGAGMNIIKNAVENGRANPLAFALKMIFTVVTIGAGFKGGEIIPTFFIGATFGCLIGSLIGLNPSFGAAVGLIAMFCGVTNCPLTAMFLSIDLFGDEGSVFFALCCAVSYMLSGYTGLYSSQKIMYSKIKPEYINEQVH